MQYNDTNEQGLLALVAALKGGMDPGTGTQMYGMIEQQQAQDLARRQERLSGLADLLTQAAVGGMPYAGASALAEAQPGPAGPAVQNMLSSLYPSQGMEAPAPPMSASGQPIEPPPGYYDQTGPPAGMNIPNVGPQALSPAFQPAPMSPTEQQAQMEMDQAAATEPVWGAVTADLATAKAQHPEITPQDAIGQIMAGNPEVAAILSADPGRLQGILETVYGAGAMKYAGMTPTIG